MTTLAEWILRGGDTRLDLDPATHANKYGCTPLPDPQLQSFSSCTARSISDSALQAVQLACADQKSGDARGPKQPEDGCPAPQSCRRCWDWMRSGRKSS